MKILGISLGTKNGNNDTMCRVALKAAKKAGADIEFINIWDWKIRECKGCVACSIGLVTGKGMVCTRKDDFPALYQKMIDADGILFCDPIFECGASGMFHTLSDRMGPGHDTGMLIGAHMKMKEQGKKGLDPKIFNQKAISFVGIGGSDWGTCCEVDHAMLAMTPGWKIVNNEHFAWCKDIIMQDDKIERMKQIGKNLAEAAEDIAKENKKAKDFPIAENEKSYWMGEDGTCPHCHCNNFYIVPGTTHCICEVCGLEGTLTISGGAFHFEFDKAEEYKAHDIVSGKKLHGDDIQKNETNLMHLYRDPEFKKRKEKYTAVAPSVPGPIKQEKMEKEKREKLEKKENQESQ